MSTWEHLQKPYKGKHWWYRLLTGRKDTFPVMRQVGYQIYWKQNIKTKEYVPCKLLNFLSWFSNRYRDFKNLIYIKF